MSVSHAQVLLLSDARALQGGTQSLLGQQPPPLKKDLLSYSPTPSRTPIPS